MATRLQLSLHRWPRAALSALVVLAVWPAPVSMQVPAARVVAIGDIHGAYDELTTILRSAKLVDAQLRWSGGPAVLVQTGDYTDRGRDVRKVMDLLMQLETEARAAGGQARVLAGNHEIMNVIGDLRDVTPEICVSFTTDNSARLREETWTKYERIARTRGRMLTPTPAVYSQTRETWMEAHPLGCLEYGEAMGPDGAYGRWLRRKDIATVVGDTLFMHAGLNPSRAAPASIPQVNDRVRAEVRQLDAFRQQLVDRNLALPSFSLREVIDVAVAELRAANMAIDEARAKGTRLNLDFPFLKEAETMLEVAKWSLVDPEGPLWFRGYASWDEEETSAQVLEYLKRLKLARIVVGHTPTPDRRIAVRYGGSVAVIDTGMLTAYYKGLPSALEILGPQMKAIYPDGETDLSARPQP